MQTTNVSTTWWSRFKTFLHGLSLVTKILIICVLVFLIVLLIAACIFEKEMETTIKGEEIGENGLRYKYGECIYDPETDDVLLDSIDWIHIHKGDSIGILAKNNKRAYINLNTAQLITPLTYDKAWQFACNRGVMTKGDSLYVFRRDGSKVNNKGIYHKNNYDIIYYRGYLVVDMGQNHIGLMDTAATWVLPAQYTTIDIDYHHNFINTRVEDKCILYDEKLNIVLQGNYKCIDVDWSEGLIVTEYDGIQHLFSYEGELVYRVIFRELQELTYNTHRTDAQGNDIYQQTDCLVYSNYNGKRGLMDKHYNVLTPPIFHNITSQTRHVFFATFGDYCDEFGTLIDEHGRAIR